MITIMEKNKERGKRGNNDNNHRVEQRGREKRKQ